MPVPKGVDPKKYDDCVDKVKRKGSAVNAYAVCAASLKGKAEKCMDGEGYKMEKKKLVKAIEEKFAGKDLNDETVKTEVRQEISKALAAGYGGGTAAPESVKEVDAGPGSTPAAKPEESAAPAPEAAPGAVAPKFGGGLFKPFALGATLKQQEHGNVMTGMKKPMMDYVKVQQGIIRNEKMTADQLSKLSTPKKK